VVFPISDLPRPLQIVAEYIPLTHCVRLVRAIILPGSDQDWILSLVYIIIFTVIAGFLAIRRLRKRLVA